MIKLGGLGAKFDGLTQNAMRPAVQIDTSRPVHYVS